MEITRRCVDGIPILDLAGRFVVSTGPAGGALRASIAKLVAEGDVSVLVHLARVTDIDAHGLGQLAGASTMLRRWLSPTPKAGFGSVEFLSVATSSACAARGTSNRRIR